MPAEASLAVNGLSMPRSFPTQSFEETYKQALALRGPYQEQFVGAWNAVSYRFQACEDYGDSFEASFKQHGAAPTRRTSLLAGDGFVRLLLQRILSL